MIIPIRCFTCGKPIAQMFGKLFRKLFGKCSENVWKQLLGESMCWENVGKILVLGKLWGDPAGDGVGAGGKLAGGCGLAGGRRAEDCRGGPWGGHK